MNRKSRRASSAKDGIVRVPDGRRLAVIRPDDPAAALALAQRALDEQDEALLDSLPNRVGCQYTFIGWLSLKDCKVGAMTTRMIVNDEGKQIGLLLAGDSFVTFENDDPKSAVVEKGDLS